MKSRMISIVISVIIATSISTPITVNVGQQSSSSNGIGGLHLSNISESNPQNVGQPSPNPSETDDPVLSNIPAPIPQIVGQSSLSLSGTCGLAVSPWPMFRGNLNHTGQSLYGTSDNNGQLKWSFLTSGGVYSSPAIDNYGMIYVGSGDHRLYAINSDGTEKWNFKTNGPVESSPAISADGTIYVGSWDNNLYAINLNGSKKWSFTTGFSIHSSPAIGPEGTIYIGSFDGKLYAINPDGTEKWSFTTELHVESSPAIGSDGTIYVGSFDSKVYAINPDGTEKWNFTTGSGILSSPAIGSDGTIYVGSVDSKLYAINPDGTEKWKFVTGRNIYSSPAIGSDGTVYVGSGDNNLYAINPDGTERWRFITEGVVHSSPAIGFDGTIYVGSSDDYIYAINPDGTEKWKYNTSGNITGFGNVESSPAIGFDGTIYVGSWEYQLYAIGTSNQPPIAYTGSDQTVYEGDVVHFNGSTSYDPNGTIETYEWDFDKSDGLWWETGAVPDAIGPTPVNIFGDDGLFIATLRVTDNNNLTATDICNITVLNVDPKVTIQSAIMDVEIGLRVAGRKYNDVSMILYEDGNPIGNVSIERMPGSPNDQMAWIPITLNMTKTYNATVFYTPEDPPNIGGNPVWIYIKFKNGSTEKIHHTFNVQQSKKRDSDHWNHVEPWEVDLNTYLIGCQFEVTSHITDPGSDDEVLTYTYGSQTVTVKHMNNPPNLDPYPSPEVKPMDIMDTTILVYEGPGTVTLVVKDDDNIRLGVGQGSDSFVVS